MPDWVPAVTKPYMLAVTLVTAGVEQQVDILVDVPLDPNSIPIKALQIKSRSAEALEMAWESGGDHTTIPSGSTYWKEGMNAVNLTVYLTGVSNGQVAEIEYWK